MGVFQATQLRTFLASVDLSAKQYYAVALDTSNQNKVVLANAQTLPTIGILQNNPKSGDEATVLMANRTTYAIAGGTIAIGAAVTVNASGLIIATTTAADQVIGIALEAAVSGDRFEIMITDKFYHA